MEHHIQEVPFLSRYFSYGNLSDSTKHVWIVCHGYGQLAQYFIKKFEVLDSEVNYIIAPEGMNRFYLEGFKGRVGAAWMTKEDRLIDIENYCQQLNAIYNSIFRKNLTNAKIHLLGFSQGTATVSRWLMRSNISIDSLIIWGGKIAHEIDLTELSKRLNKTSTYLVLGTQDEFYSEQLLAEYLKDFSDAGISAERILFNGKHNLDEETIRLLGSQFEKYS